MELCLGSVQFGMNYGVRGQKQPSLKEAVDMLDYATQNGIDTIDTAYNYGSAEEVIGCFIQDNRINRNKISIISKLQPNIIDDKPIEQWYSIMRENLISSLSRLHTDYLDGYLFHSSRYIFDEYLIECLNGLKKEGLVKNVGVSIYEQKEAEAGVNSDLIDMIQIPFSIFDQRLDKGGFFENNKFEGKKLFSRSAFLQGLILMEENEVPIYLQKAVPIIKKIKEVSKQYNISRVSLAINFVKMYTKINYLVFGVDNMKQLKENINEFIIDNDKDIIRLISDKFQNLDADIVMPSLWHKN